MRRVAAERALAMNLGCKLPGCGKSKVPANDRLSFQFAVDRIDRAEGQLGGRRTVAVVPQDPTLGA